MTRFRFFAFLLHVACLWCYAEVALPGFLRSIAMLSMLSSLLEIMANDRRSQPNSLGSLRLAGKCLKYWFAKYVAYSYTFECEEDANSYKNEPGPLLVICYPHGTISLAVQAGWILQVCGSIADRRTDVRPLPVATTDWIGMDFPFSGSILGWWGWIPATSQSMLHALRAGHDVATCPEGCAGALSNERRRLNFDLNAEAPWTGRKSRTTNADPHVSGRIDWEADSRCCCCSCENLATCWRETKNAWNERTENTVALETAYAEGIAAVPVFNQGENELFDSLPLPLFLRRLLFRACGAAVHLSFGPYPCTLTSRIGRPVRPADFDSFETFAEQFYRGLFSLVRKHSKLPAAPRLAERMSCTMADEPNR